MSAQSDTRRLLDVLNILVVARYLDWGALTVAEIRMRLPARRRVHVRTMQRDLLTLRKWFALRVDRRVKPYRWAFVGAECPCCWHVSQARSRKK